MLQQEVTHFNHGCKYKLIYFFDCMIYYKCNVAGKLSQPVCSSSFVLYFLYSLQTLTCVFCTYYQSVKLSQCIMGTLGVLQNDQNRAVPTECVKGFGINKLHSKQHFQIMLRSSAPAIVCNSACS